MTTPPEEAQAEGLKSLAAKLIPAAVIFADSEEHVADLRRRAVETLKDALAALSPEKVGMREALEAIVHSYAMNCAEPHGLAEALAPWIEKAALIVAALGLPPPVVSGFTEDLGRLGSEDDPPQGLRPLDREPAGGAGMALMREALAEAIRFAEQDAFSWAPWRVEMVARWKVARGLSDNPKAIKTEPFDNPPEGLAPPSVSHVKGDLRPSHKKSSTGKAKP